MRPFLPFGSIVLLLLSPFRKPFANIAVSTGPNPDADQNIALPRFIMLPRRMHLEHS
jgi:hypothetical protein